MPHLPSQFGCCASELGRPLLDALDHLPQTEVAFLKRTKAIQEVAKAQSVKETVYFDKDWNLVESKDPQGYYRESYGLQDNGLYLIQDF